MEQINFASVHIQKLSCFQQQEDTDRRSSDKWGSQHRQPRKYFCLDWGADEYDSLS